MTQTSLDLVRSRRQRIAEELSRLSEEDAELAAAERVLSRLLPADEAAPVRSAVRPRSQREFVLDALEHSESVWLSVSDMLGAVKARWGVRLPVESVRPLLSVMKNEGLIARRKRLVAAQSRARHEGSSRLK